MNPETRHPLGFADHGEPDRPAVVFLHGFMGSRSDWADVTAALGDGFRRVAVDLPGHGASLGLPDAAYGVGGAVRALLETLDGLGIERPVLVGYSMGGRLALYLALRHPDRCAGLFLESASPGLPDAAERAARRRADEGKARRLERDPFEEFLQDWYRQPLFASLARDGDLLHRTIEARRANVPAELAKSLRGSGVGNQPSLWDELPDLRAPALAVAGGLDEKFAAISRRMEGLAPRLRSATVAGAGHSVRVEAPRAYLTLMRDLLSGTQRQAGPRRC